MTVVRPANENIVEPSLSIHEAMSRMEVVRRKILLIADADGHLIGTLTDGDFRRFILRTHGISGTVLDVAQREPVVLREDFNPGHIPTLFRTHDISCAPVIDAQRRVTGLVCLEEPGDGAEINVPVVLMAGGLGRRLMPLTANCPKPLLPLGDKPILAHIIGQFKRQGFRRFFISVNYLGHMIEEYFGSGHALGVEISYLRENKRLGTGGALDLLPRNMDEPFIVMNGDLITEVDFRELVRHHLDSRAVATMCVREHLTSIPFGVVNFEGSRYIGVQEKPTLHHHINAGIYCLSQAARQVVPSDAFYDMPTMFSDLSRQNLNCSVHAIADTWIDVGTPEQYEFAQRRISAEMAVA